MEDVPLDVFAEFQEFFESHCLRSPVLITIQQEETHVNQMTLQRVLCSITIYVAASIQQNSR
jgi:hypothetical protein